MEYCWNLFNNSNTTNHPHPHPHAWDSLNLPSPTTSREHWTAYPPPPSMPHHHGRGDPHYVNPDPHLTCLKLGKRNYFEDATATPTPTPTPKKGKSYIHAPEGMVVPRCQVEGCGAPLVDAKDYHRRHKVCEAHAKEPRVVVLGMEQRFCQQCSRFHAVSEFDEAKRSCRRRLAGHNERRRKSSQEQNALARKHSQDIKMMGKGGMLLNSSECAHSPLSQASDLPARCSAALRDLIAENRASCRHLFQMDSFRAGPIPGAHHVTLNLMQAPNSAFGLLSKSSKQDAHHDHQQDSSHHIWKLPLGY